MKSLILNILSILTVILIVTGCKKGSMDLFTNHSDYLPAVTMVSVESLGDTILLTGKVTSTGSYPLEFTGFCYSKNHFPEITDNQILIGDDETFRAYVFNLKPTDTFYFMSFAANDYGYVKGNVIQFIVPLPVPVTPPCVLGNDKITDGGFSYAASTGIASTQSPVAGNFGISVSCWSSGGNDYSFGFQSAPFTGIYVTSSIEDIDFNNPYNKNVYFEVNAGMSGVHSAAPGSKVYITNKNGKFTVSFCDLVYSVDGTPVHVKGNFHTN